jgi:hypothetical protein
MKKKQQSKSLKNLKSKLKKKKVSLVLLEIKKTLRDQIRKVHLVRKLMKKKKNQKRKKKRTKMMMKRLYQ